jgi:hypothetical protein
MGIAENGHFDVDQKIPGWVDWETNIMPELINKHSIYGLTRLEDGVSYIMKLK